MNNNKRTVPLGIMLIAYFYTFGAIILLIFLFTDPVQVASAIAIRHGLPPSTGSWILLVIAGLAMLIGFGLFSLSRWGFVLAVVYLHYFGIVNWFFYAGEASWTSLGNGLWAFLAILYLILKRKCFFKMSAKTLMPQSDTPSHS